MLWEFTKFFIFLMKLTDLSDSIARNLINLDWPLEVLEISEEGFRPPSRKKSTTLKVKYFIQTWSSKRSFSI